MIFGPVPAQDAAGAILAHSMMAVSGRVQKGTCLEMAHITDLVAGGHDTLVVARLEPGDVDENAAAAQVAQAIVHHAGDQNLRISAAGAGRVNLYATAPGVVEVSADKVVALNSIDPMITLATLPNYQRVDVGAMVATIKIISYAVSETKLKEACRQAHYAMFVSNPIFRTATLIETHVGDGAPSPKGRAAMVTRMERLGVSMTDRVVVPHKSADIAGALRDAPGQVLFVLTASATSDALDVAPQAVRDAGGRIETYGMPVDPGNLLFLGWLKDRPVIGLPGCARSLALNGADWVLERVICDVPVTRADVAAMGVGGLLKEIPTRPRPRAT
ncbi:MAG: molybdopterin-binding protein [Tateyamaria sp.]|uniref:molybdopterin-binding protein n=1 Tax=Tateyamaria sp. TaxID=1929288 RepID=UPI00329C079D